VNNQACLHLVILEGSKNRAGSLAATLMDAGYAVHFDQVQDIKSLKTSLRNADPDVVLYGEGTKLPAIETVAKLLRQVSGDIPLIVVANSTPREDEVITARNSGADTVVSHEQPEHLQLAVRQELKHAQLHQRVGNLESQLENIRLQQRITELDTALKEAQLHSIDLVRSSRDSIAYIHEGKHVFVNQSYADRFGYKTPEDIQGTPLLNVVDSRDHGILSRILQNDYNKYEDLDLELRLIHPSAHRYKTPVEFTSVIHENRLCTRIIVRALAGQADINSALDTVSRQDITSGLYNRQYFMEVVGENIREGVHPDRTQAITYVLLDNFKATRERLGVTASDRVIGNIAALIDELYGRNDTVARFGDYVFCILNNAGHSDETCQLAETLRLRVEENFLSIDGNTAHITCSIGICFLQEQTRDAQDAVTRADLACEVARSSGGNQIHVHSTAVENQINRETEKQWSDIIEKTIAAERYYLLYQPIISLKGAAGSRFEVLLRVLDEHGHAILPGQFIAYAEKNGIAGKIDRRVIDTALKHLGEQLHVRRDTSFFIKITSNTLADSEFPAWLLDKLIEYSLEDGSVIFEIPEAVAVRNLEQTATFVSAMHEIDCKVAIEHIGQTSKTELLRGLPVDYFKIDGYLTSNLAGNTGNQAIVQLITDFARSRNIPCIAEHIDNAGSLAYLCNYPIEYIQGNFVQEPDMELGYTFEDHTVLSEVQEETHH
jgi:diguanylate cyclase (GGDEF)-like protein